MAFDKDLAELTVKLSRYSYRSADRARENTAALRLTGFHLYSLKPNEAISVTDADHLYVAFRGTEASVVDWVQNAEFSAVLGELGKRVHSGYVSRHRSRLPPEFRSARTTARPLSTRFEPVSRLRGFDRWFTRCYTSLSR